MRSLGEVVVVGRKARRQEHLGLVVPEVREDTHDPTTQGVALMQRRRIIRRDRFHPFDQGSSRGGQFENHALAGNVLPHLRVQAAVFHRELVGEASRRVVNWPLGAPHERAQLPARVGRIETEQPIAEYEALIVVQGHVRAEALDLIQVSDRKGVVVAVNEQDRSPVEGL